MEKTLNLIWAEQKRQGDVLHQLINAVGATNVKFAEIDGKVTEINEKVTDLDRKVATIETKLDFVFTEVKEVKAKWLQNMTLNTMIR
ncbi:hypothetical protein [Neobacillus sp. FSL H8-0543]|uniref:hypothetical protein n=1 Tax=Neobacillus sp. FSL H8-0543 TaxID=2954672 RepID=UPI003158A819